MEPQDLRFSLTGYRRVARGIKARWAAIEVQDPDLSGGLGYHLAAPNNGQAPGAKTDRFDRIGGLKEREIGVAANREAVAIIKVHYPRCVGRDGLEAEAHRLAAGELPDMEAHMGDIEHVSAAERVPRVHRAVLAERDIDPMRSHLRHARLTAPLRIGVMTACNTILISGLATAWTPASAINGKSFET
jgi:hypothetical protein